MVLTRMLAVPSPLASKLGLTVQVVKVAAIGSEQDRLTCDAKPFSGVTETMALTPNAKR